MKILLFGGSGQLGKEILARANDLNFELVYPTSRTVDVCSVEQVNSFIGKAEPDLIINAAAYTAVDDAEDHEDEAFALNSKAALYISKAARVNGARLFQISTDYVFKGNLGRALKEDDECEPISVYGKTKLAGERHVQSEYPGNSLIIRTSSLHGEFGNNIVHTLIRLFNERDEVKFIEDQIMSPTAAWWLAEVLLDLARLDVNGIINASCKGEISWYDFAKKVYEYALELGLTEREVDILPVKASEFATKAKRPEYSALDVSKLEQVLGREVISWEMGLKKHMNSLVEK